MFFMHMLGDYDLSVLVSELSCAYDQVTGGIKSFHDIITSSEVITLHVYSNARVNK
jgi:hypothetical protein